jgi:hypothetical protein
MDQYERRRHESIRLVPCKYHDGEKALVFAGGNMDNYVCVTEVDLAELRRVISQEDS